MTILFDNYNLNRFAQKMAGDADALRSSPVPEQDNLSGTRPGPAGQTPLPLSEERKDPPTRGPAGILVVDDEQLIREVLKRFLQLAGFRVFLAASEHEAVELYRHQAEAINAVLLDVRMPGLDGPATLTALRGLDPRVRCCFMSGDLGMHSPEELFRLGALALFEKPLHMNELAETLRRVINSPAAT